MDPFAQYAVAAAHHGPATTPGSTWSQNPTRIGAMVASGVGGLGTFQDQLSSCGEGHRPHEPAVHPDDDPQHGGRPRSRSSSAPRARCSAICTACAAGSNAIGDAFEMVSRGRADAMFAGGSEAPICNVGVGAFAAMRALLDAQRRARDRRRRPFDSGRDGFVMGEGAGMLVLEELEHAEAARRPRSTPRSSATA